VIRRRRRSAIWSWADPNWSMMMWRRRELERQETLVTSIHGAIGLK
jgi:hypothetical protein